MHDRFLDSTDAYPSLKQYEGSNLEIDGVMDAFQSEGRLDGLATAYYQLVDLTTKPGERTESECRKIKRNAAILCDPESGAGLTKKVIDQWDATCELSGRLWPAYMSALGQLGLSELVLKIEEQVMAFEVLQAENGKF